MDEVSGRIKVTVLRGTTLLFPVSELTDIAINETVIINFVDRQAKNLSFDNISWFCFCMSTAYVFTVQKLCIEIRTSSYQINLTSLRLSQRVLPGPSSIFCVTVS